MCLTLRYYNNKPYNKSCIRYKVLRKTRSKKKFQSLYYGHDWKLGEWEQSSYYYGSDHNRGFHVFVKLRDTFKYTKSTIAYAIVMVQVRGFVASGKWQRKLSETWKEAKIIKVMEPHGAKISNSKRRNTL